MRKRPWPAKAFLSAVVSRSLLVFALLIASFSLPAAAQMQYKEAPMLAQLVAQGLLPPVEERLPLEPLIVEVVEEIGQYGGTWRRAALSVTDDQIVGRLSYEGLVRWNADGSDVVPNVAKAWEVSDDGRVFTFYLREGMKWSDGHPFTADDIAFWWNDVILNEELTPVPPNWLTIDGELPTFTQVDQYTIRWEFPKPYGLFLRNLATYTNFEESMTQYPKHYLSQFHPNYTPKEQLDAMVAQAQLDEWFQLFRQRMDPRLNPEVPVIYAWRVTRPSPAQPVVAERNPYYWKVDPEGNQLPYIDRVTHFIVENIEVLNLRAATGEIDMQLRHILIDNLPVFVENQERHDYRILMWQGADTANFLIYPNLFVEDEGLRALNRDVRLRRALSLAIDRDEINNLAYLGLGRPRQHGVIPQSQIYEEGVDQVDVERNLAEANRLLDEIGLTQRDSEGYRLRPDGTRLEITIDLTPVFGPWTKVAELIIDYWREIGIRARLNVMERSLFQERAASGSWQWAVWMSDRGLTPEVEPLFLLPGRGQTAYSPWMDWFTTNGARGEAPPEGSPERRAYEIYAQVKATTDRDELVALMRELIRLNVENHWYIGTVGDMPHIVIVKNNFRNVPEMAVSDWLQKTPGNTWPEQYFIKQ